MNSEPTKYATLLRILDAVRDEASGTRWSVKYAVGSSTVEAIQQARSLAYIHLYLKVMFGISDFGEREGYITDGAQDGGIDAYYIDTEIRRIYLIQSKFRNTEKNFEQKEISLEELIVMDIDRITAGHEDDENGVRYNGKVQGLIRKISETVDIARYSYQIVIIANSNLPSQHIRKLTNGHNATVFNFERSYEELVFPILSGTYFRAEDVTIRLDLNNKSAGAKTSYSVETPEYQCEITVLFVPTLEIAKAMDKYRNSILEYNPRGYLDLIGQQVNHSIRETLLRPDSNAFALMNNGITIISDETNINERIGQKNKAQLRILRPQIINGGQTAYTLSRVYGEDREGAEAKFEGKEVLTKIITLTAKDPTKDTAREQMGLIDEISAASNRQTPVINADRVANEAVYTAVQKLLFARYGLLFERKRGEFSDGVNAGYIDEAQVLERNLFIRILMTVRGELNKAKTKRIFLSHRLTDEQLTDEASLDLFVDGYTLFKHLSPRKTIWSFGGMKYRNILPKLYIGVRKTNRTDPIEDRVKAIEILWAELAEQLVAERRGAKAKEIDYKTGKKLYIFSEDRWITGSDFQADLLKFVETGRIPVHVKKVAIRPSDIEEFENLLSEHSQPIPAKE
ncbi:AIPR protein [Mesorhizobium sp. M8A.F.Ca.ET.173.01.1.1]|nr:AIPR protein [Mesorhizobium sp. M8A.F.Ca.ET.173.01.1.1]